MFSRAWVAGFLVVLGGFGAGLGDDKAKPASVGRCLTEVGSILRREAPGKPWKLVKEKEAVPSGELLLAATDAAIETNNAAVRLLLVGGVGGTSPLPIIETAIVLNAADNVDLDFSLLRGRVDIVNNKSAGEAKVRVRGREHAALIRLLEPGTRVALVVSGRWPAGAPFKKDANPKEHCPAEAFALLVIKGEIELKADKHDFHMHAPPGPALLEGDGVAHTDPAPHRLEKLPDWAAGHSDSAESKDVRKCLARFHALAQAKSIDDALDTLLQSDNATDRRVAVYYLGAMDDLERLGPALALARHRDVWETGVEVLRHWLGREPGQDLKLYKFLEDKRHFTPAQAETVLHLLHSLSRDELTRPDTYEGLIDMLESDKLAIRGLAHWHLVRLVPAGKKFDFDPLALPAKRAEAVKQWRALIPHGKLPPASK